MTRRAALFPQAPAVLTEESKPQLHDGRAVEALDLETICQRLAPELAQMSGKSLLITGGAGFLGYYLVRTILHHNRSQPRSQAIELTLYDNYQRGMPHWLRELQGHEHLQVEDRDVTSALPSDMPAMHYILHAASIASPSYYRQHPLETMDANVVGLRRLLDRCVQWQESGRGVEGFLFFSTSEIYGDPPPEHIPTPETYRGNVSCTGPRACYDESKRYGETLCVTFHRQHGLPVRIVRPFNNYGPGLRLRDRRLLADFARAVLAGRDLEMYSDGSPTRTFCYIADAVVGYFQALVRGRNGEAYNIGTDSPEVSVADFANRVVKLAAELFAYPGRVVHRVHEDQDYLVDNPIRRCPDISKATQELGYEATVDLDEGLRRSLLWYRDQAVGGA